MAIANLPANIQANYEVHEWRHGCSILQHDFPAEYDDIITVLSGFSLRKSEILTRGGRKSPIANRIDAPFIAKGWVERSWDTGILVDGTATNSPTHSVDCYKNRVALEVEWNNKDPFYDRDLNNFRLLFDLRIISVGVIITRCSDLQAIFDTLGKGDSYGSSTTHMNKLIPRIEGGGGGGCPLLVFGITQGLYDATK